MSARMNPEVKAAWVAALRSGKYQQGQRRLCVEDGGERRFCCLGVLEDLRMQVDGDKWHQTPGLAMAACPDGRPHVTFTAFPSHETIRWSGLTDAVRRTMPADGIDPGIPHDDEAPAMHLCSMLNDCAGWTFAQLAGWIEENL